MNSKYFASVEVGGTEACAGFEEGARPYPPEEATDGLGLEGCLPEASSLLILMLAGTSARRDLSFWAATRAGTVDDPVIVVVTSVLTVPPGPRLIAGMDGGG